MKLVSVSDCLEAPSILYDLLAERPFESRISHEKLPKYADHCAFVKLHPFRYWFLIQTADLQVPFIPDAYVGSIEVTDRNEIGVSILKKHQRMGYATRALSMFLDLYEPLPAIPAIRNGKWLANIGIKNEGSKVFFKQFGFRPLQETHILG